MAVNKVRVKGIDYDIGGNAKLEWKKVYEGTHIIEDGYEDMCYEFMFENFTLDTTKKYIAKVSEIIYGYSYTTSIMSCDSSPVAGVFLNSSEENTPCQWLIDSEGKLLSVNIFNDEALLSSTYKIEIYEQVLVNANVTEPERLGAELEWKLYDVAEYTGEEEEIIDYMDICFNKLLEAGKTYSLRYQATMASDDFYPSILDIPSDYKKGDIISIPFLMRSYDEDCEKLGTLNYTEVYGNRGNFTLCLVGDSQYAKGTKISIYEQVLTNVVNPSNTKEYQEKLVAGNSISINENNVINVKSYMSLDCNIVHFNEDYDEISIEEANTNELVYSRIEFTPGVIDTTKPFSIEITDGNCTIAIKCTPTFDSEGYPIIYFIVEDVEFYIDYYWNGTEMMYDDYPSGAFYGYSFSNTQIQTIMCYIQLRLFDFDNFGLGTRLNRDVSTWSAQVLGQPISRLSEIGNLIEY